MRIGVFSVVDHYPHELPRTESMFYSELLEQVKLADELGLDSFWIAEHHFHEYGAIPRPAIWLSAAAQHTGKIRLGTAVAVLPFDNPVRVAEDFAMVDILSQGRLNLGIGSGYLKHEFDGFAIDPEEKRQRFDEALEIMLRAWEGKAFSFSGSIYNIADVRINVRPLQMPHPPVFIAALRYESVPFIAEKGFPVMLIPYASSEGMTDITRAARSYREAYHKAGHQGTPRVVVSLHLHCADTTARARSEAQEPLARYVRTRLYAKQRSFDSLLEKELVAFGDPDEITRVLRLYEEAGATDFLAITNFGGMPHNQVMSSITLLSEQISRMPATAEVVF